MLQQIEEIQGLATKYSKAELGRMVQMGLLEPQKAMMAGMMIQRISQQNAQPPQTTVAQDVLGLPAVTSPEQAQQQPQQPQAQQGGVAALPQQQAQPQPQGTGIEGLPAGDVGSYAGGGIVSFDDGGEVPGYAGDPKNGSLVTGPNDPKFQVDPAVQRARDSDRMQILQFEYKDALRREAEGDPRAAQDVLTLAREIERERKRLGIAPVNPEKGAAITALPPPVKKEAVVPVKKKAPPPANGVETALDQRQRQMEQDQIDMLTPVSAVGDVMQAPLMGAGVATANTLTGVQNLFGRLGNAITGDPERTTDNKYMDYDWTPFTDKLRKRQEELNKRNAPKTPVAGKGTATKPPVETAANPPGALPANKAANTTVATTVATELPPIARPEVKATSYEDYVRQTTPTVGKLTAAPVEDLATLAAKRKEAYAAEGYDPEMYNKRIMDLENKRDAAGGGKEKDRAMGAAIMTAGLKLMGARRGQEFQALSEGAQEGLKGYQAAVKDMKTLQDKYDERMDAYRLADMQARKTGVDSDMARRDKHLEAARTVETDLFKATNAANTIAVQAATQLTNADKQLFASTYSTNVTAQTHRDSTAALKAQGLQDSQIKNIMDNATEIYKGMLLTNPNANFNEAVRKAFAAYRTVISGIAGGTGNNNTPTAPISDFLKK